MSLLTCCEALFNFRSLPIKTLNQILVAKEILIITISCSMRENKENMIFHFWIPFYYHSSAQFKRCWLFKYPECTETDIEPGPTKILKGFSHLQFEDLKRKQKWVIWVAWTWTDDCLLPKKLSLETPQQRRKRRQPTGKIVIPYDDEGTDLLWNFLSQHFEMPSIF